MLQIVGLLGLSWLLLWAVEKRNLSALGLLPTPGRLKYSSLLFLVSALISASALLLKILIAKEEYSLNPTLTPTSVLLACWHQFRSVLTEELLCRGALLFILIKKIGTIKAIIISAVLFAALHWMNAGVWGHMAQMILLFVFTFAMGLLLAFAYARSFSLLLPLGIHFGWNLVQNFIFPDHAAGITVFTLNAPPPQVTVSYTALFVLILFPKIFVLLVDYLIVRKYSQAKVG